MADKEEQERKMRIWALQNDTTQRLMLEGIKRTRIAFFIMAVIAGGYGLVSLLFFPALRHEAGHDLACGISIGAALGVAVTAWLLPFLIKTHVMARPAEPAKPDDQLADRR